MFCFMRAWTRPLFVSLAKPMLLLKKIKEGKKEERKEAGGG